MLWNSIEKWVKELVLILRVQNLTSENSENIDILFSLFSPDFDDWLSFKMYSFVIFFSVGLHIVWILVFDSNQFCPKCFKYYFYNRFPWSFSANKQPILKRCIILFCVKLQELLKLFILHSMCKQLFFCMMRLKNTGFNNPLERHSKFTVTEISSCTYFTQLKADVKQQKKKKSLLKCNTMLYKFTSQSEIEWWFQLRRQNYLHIVIDGPLNLATELEFLMEWGIEFHILGPIEVLCLLTFWWFGEYNN